MTRAQKVGRKKRAPRKSTNAVAVRPPQNMDVSRALLDSGEGAGDPSVDDPLQDWPETEQEQDAWLLERHGKDTEAPDR